MRIAIVNDLLLAVEAVRRVIFRTSEHQLAWIAQDGAQAVELCARDRPDLILMDLIMPRMDGVEATRRIMAGSPCPIVVVTANVRDRSSQVFEAMGAGALDAVDTPVLISPETSQEPHPLLSKIDTIRRLTGGNSSPFGLAVHPGPPATGSVRPAPLVAIGASAGGPAALARVLTNLPVGFPAPIVVVQHVDEQFVQGLANWLDCQVPFTVRLAQEGDSPEPGTVLVAGRDGHLVFASPARLAYRSEPLESSYRPSIDVFFKSAARHWHGEVIGVLLTGMGRDGAEGLRTLRARGHHTLAQNEQTSAVFGMPKAAAELAAASEILALDKIAPRLASILTRKHGGHV